MRRDFRLEEIVMLGRHIAGDYQRQPRAARDLNRAVRTFNLLNTPEKHERRFRARIWAEFISRDRDSVEDDPPGPELRDMLEQMAANGRKPQRAAR